MKYKNYVMAKSLEEAYSLNQKKNNVIVAGNGWLRLSKGNRDTLIDLSDLGLDYILEEEKQIRIGAMTTLRTLEESKLLNDLTNGSFKKAFKAIVGVQFRNMVTVGGSLWGSYGFSDVLTLFLGLNAKLKLYPEGIIDLNDFTKDKYLNSIIEEVIIENKQYSISYQAFRNQANDFPVLTCVVSKENDNLLVAVGARPMQAKVVSVPLETSASNIADLYNYSSNTRASKEYRKHLAKVLINRAILEIGE